VKITADAAETLVARARLKAGCNAPHRPGKIDGLLK